MQDAAPARVTPVRSTCDVASHVPGGDGAGEGDGGGGDGDGGNAGEGGGGDGDGEGGNDGDGGGGDGPVDVIPAMCAILTNTPVERCRTHSCHTLAESSSVTVVWRLSSRNPKCPGGKGVAQAAPLGTQPMRSFLTSVWPPEKVSTCGWSVYIQTMLG